MSTVHNTVTITHEDPKIRKQIAEAAVGSRLFSSFLPVPKGFAWVETMYGDDPERVQRVYNVQFPKWPSPAKWKELHWGCLTEATYEDGSLSMTGNDVTISFTTEDTPPLQWYAWMQSKHGIACSNIKHEII